MEKKIYAVLNFLENIRIQESVLGVSYPIKIGDFIGEIHLPKVSDNPADKIDVQNSNLKAPDNYKILENVTAVSKTWGKLYEPKNETDLKQVTINKAVIILNLGLSDPNTLQSALITWLIKFHKNIRILVDEFNGLQTGKKKQTLDTQFFLLDEKTKLLSRAGPLVVNLSFDQLRRSVLTTPHQFSSACDAASANQALNLEYDILLKSFKAYQTTDFRNAIIESATALEISLTKAIKIHLTSIGVTGIKRLIKQNSMLSNLFKFAIAKGMVIPIGYSEIIKMRNNVIHAGFYPSEQEAYSIINNSLAYIRMFTPQVHEL